jgi:hypothetical protein
VTGTFDGIAAAVRAAVEQSAQQGHQAPDPNPNIVGNPTLSEFQSRSQSPSRMVGSSSHERIKTFPHESV